MMLLKTSFGMRKELSNVSQTKPESDYVAD